MSTRNVKVTFVNNTRVEFENTLPVKFSRHFIHIHRWENKERTKHFFVSLRQEDVAMVEETVDAE